MVNYLLDCFSQVFNLLCRFFVGWRFAYPTYGFVGRESEAPPGEQTTLFFILLLNRRQNTAQDVQLLGFRTRAGEHTAQLVHHLSRVTFTDKAG